MSEPLPIDTPLEKLSEVERLKAGSRYLRGTIVESLADRLTAAVTSNDNTLLKFHGTYQQDDRDLRNERARQRLEPAFAFMVRIRAPGGIVTPGQWLALDQLARQYGNGTMRLTTRQSFQLHGVVKWHLKETIHDVNRALLSTLAACGDVNRNVMCNPNPYQSDVHGAVYEWSKQLSEALEPKTTAYHEIWIDDKKVVDSREDHEPLYGATYLPRKFKIAIAVPPSNDVDVFANDLGYVAIVDDKGGLAGFNVLVGGGMGMTHGEPATWPNLAWSIGFCLPAQTMKVADKVLSVQRDYGDRVNRKHARLKYTITDRGVAWFKEELERRLGFALAAPRPFHFDHHGDRYGWTKGTNGRWHLGLFTEHGRIHDTEHCQLMTGLRKIAEEHDGDFRVTPNENLILGNISEENRPKIEKLVAEFKLSDGSRDSVLRRSSMACVALPTCALAMAESERYLPHLITKLEAIMAEVGLAEEAIVVRMTGCPNGCARPFIAEIGFVGKAPGRYNLYLGGDFTGQRLNKLYRENIDETEILATLQPILKRYAEERQPGERFGDFTIRTGYVRAVTAGPDFHA